MIRFFASHATAGNLLMLLLLALGLAALPDLMRETFPEIPSREVQVQVAYPGASAEDVENVLCRRIEDAVDGVNDLSEVRCDARENLAIAVAEMAEGAAMDRFLSDVKTKIEAIDDFPSAVEAPIIDQLGTTDYVISLAVAGPMSPADLKAYAEQVKDRLTRVPGVAEVEVTGFGDHQIRIEVPVDAQKQLGISVADVADIITLQSVDLPAGVLDTRNEEVLLRFTDERRSVRAYEDLVVVSGTTGAEIRLGDFARISDRFEPDEERLLFDGQRAAVLKINKRKSADALMVVEAVADLVHREHAMAPPAVVLELTNDASSIIRDRLNMVLKNGIQGLALVLTVMWLFFGLRYAFWVAMGLPVAFMGALFAMQLVGYSFNMISAVALLVAVGLLMDDAIVIAENIAAHRRRGKPPLEAAVTGVSEVARGVLSSFATTALVFGALAFLKGDIGYVLRVMPVVLLLVLAVSLVEAFLILPHHLTGAMRPRDRSGWASRSRARFDAGVEHLRESVIGRAVDAAVRWRYLTAGLAAALLILALGMLSGGVLKVRLFPDIDGDTVEARLLYPQGTPLSRTELLVERVTDKLEAVNAEFAARQPGGRDLVQNVTVRFNHNADAFESGAHVATVTADLLGADVRNARLDDVLSRWRELVGRPTDVISLKFTEAQLGPGGRAIDIRLQGEDLSELKGASLALQDWLRRYDGVLDLSDDLRPGKPEVRLRLREGATALGLTSAGVANQLRAAFFGKTALEIQAGRESYEVDARLAPGDRDNLDDLEYFTITLAGGKQVPLGAVAELERDRGLARVNRIDGRRTVTLQADVDARRANVNEILGDTEARFLPSLAERFPGVTVALEGQAREQSTTGASLRKSMAISLLGIYILLSFQLRNYAEPALVMSAIPLGLIGVVFGHLLMGLDLSMPSFVGFASLAGVVVNNSILLMEFIRLRRIRGESATDAARRASRGRFRAILLTATTTIAGLLPLLTETSLQAQVLIPLVTSLAFGLLTSATLVVLVLPALYVILDDFGLARDHAGEGPTAASPGGGRATVTAPASGER